MRAVLWEVASGQAAKWLWVMEFFLLMPGNLASGSVVEATLWNSQLSLRALSVINLALAVVINGAVWYGIRSVVHRVAAGKAAP